VGRATSSLERVDGASGAASATTDSLSGTHRAVEELSRMAADVRAAVSRLQH